MEEHYLDINLRRCAIIQYSSHMWKRPQLKEHLAKTSMNSTTKSKSGYRKIGEVDTMPVALHQELDKLILRPHVKNELKFATGQMGTIIRNFLEKMSSDNTSDFVDYVDHIHWSHLGCINLAETMKSLYESGLLPMNYDTWLRLCENCVEECIADFWKRISQCNEYDQLMKKISSDDVPVISNYWRLRVQNQLDNFVVDIPSFNNSKTIAEFMFQKSQEEFSHSFRYFWNRLNDDQKKSMLNQVSETRNMYGDDWSMRSWDQYVEIYMFVIKQYSIYEFECILESMPQSISMLITMLLWPWQDSFVSSVVDVCNLDLDFDCMLDIIVSELIRSMKLERSYVGNDLKTKQLFYDLWSHQEIFSEQKIKDCAKVVCNAEELQLLKYIVISEKSWEKREKILESIVAFCRPSKLNFLEKFLDEISRELDLREWFILKLTGGESVTKGS